MKYKYEIIIYWSKEDSTYIAEVPELAGCAADGNTYHEALKMSKSLSMSGSKLLNP